jgi:hypothetical protein
MLRPVSAYFATGYRELLEVSVTTVDCKHT